MRAHQERCLPTTRQAHWRRGSIVTAGKTDVEYANEMARIEIMGRITECQTQYSINGCAKNDRSALRGACEEGPGASRHSLHIKHRDQEERTSSPCRNRLDHQCNSRHHLHLRLFLWLVMHVLSSRIVCINPITRLFLYLTILEFFLHHPGRTPKLSPHQCYAELSVGTGTPKTEPHLKWEAFGPIVNCNIPIDASLSATWSMSATSLTASNAGLDRNHCSH